MPVITNKNVLLSLAWINSGEHSPNYYEVVFRLSNPETKQAQTYISFPFSSFDLMYMYLKNLARAFKICSIDNLSKNDYPVSISYIIGYESPPKLEYLYISDNNIWPSQTIKGYFLIDCPY